MSADLQMARGNVEGGFNLAVGEPEFLQERLYFGPLMDMSSSWPYPTIDGHKYLLEELRKLHPTSKYIVITNGAKQALLAAFYAYKTVDKVKAVYHEAPYWPSYPTLAKISGLEFHTNNESQKTDFYNVSCITSPNNPNGKLDPSWCHIWDAVYAGSNLYGFDGLKPNYEGAVYSAAKLLGLSGLRVGWLVTNNAELAKHASNYVEFTTSGVALPTQSYVAGALHYLNSDQDGMKKIFESARQDLLTNGDIFKTYLSNHTDDVHGVPNEGTGMFAWFKVNDVYRFNEALNKAKIRLVTGPACGGDENYFRMSMGLTPDKTEAALKALKAHL